MILEEQPNSLLSCERCGRQVPVGRLSNCHYMLEKYKQEEERRLRHETLQRCFEASRVSFHINAKTLPPSEVFLYLRWKISYNNSNWVAVHLNLRQVCGGEA